MSARDEILAAVRDAVRRSPLKRAEGDDDREGRDPSTPGPIPARAEVDGEERVQLFIDQATAVDTTVERVESMAELPGAVASYLKDTGLESTLAVHGELRSLEWEEAGLVPREEALDEEGPAVLPAFAGVAETGSLCLTSNEAPLREAFLPDTLVVVLREADLLGPYEDLWKRGREAWDEGVPSSLVFVAGPSRTADIQQTLVLGAHGPRRLRVVLVRGGVREGPGR